MNFGSLIALYGEKPSKVSEMIFECQRQILSAVGPAFTPYDLLQIHATVINLWQKVNINQEEAIHHSIVASSPKDFLGLINFLRNSGRVPFQVQICGYQDRDYPFLSRGTRPYERSFVFRGGKAVLMGWPIRGKPVENASLDVLDFVHENRIYPNSLDEIRQALKVFGFFHNYYKKPEDVDNDFYFRIGLFDNELIPESKQTEIELNIRQFICHLPPIIIEINLPDLYLASCNSETFLFDSTIALPISKADITMELINSIYERKGPYGE
jgi:hypothetical protein